MPTFGAAMPAAVPAAVPATALQSIFADPG